MFCMEKCPAAIASENGAKDLQKKSDLEQGLVTFSNHTSNFTISILFPLAVPSLCKEKR